MKPFEAVAAPPVKERPRVLFVDDDRGVLDGLRRMLRTQRGDWEMSFALGGQEALDRLECEPFDVVVTDMRMPGIDGLALLRFLREHHPDIVRIILSGHSDELAAVQALPVAHRFLSKPCKPEILIEAVRGAANVHGRLHSHPLRQLLGRMEALPSPPATVIALNDALLKPDVSIDAIGGIIAGDIAMSVKMLHLVNSSFFGLGQPVSDINSAVTFLGMNTIRDLAVSASAFHAFEGDPTVRLIVRELQAHSLAVASLAPTLVAPELRSETFIASLLHDVGLLVLAAHLPTELAEAQARLKLGSDTIQQVEEDLWGVGHAEIGAYLLSLWGIPQATVEAVACHHQPLEPDLTTLNPAQAITVTEGFLAHEGGSHAVYCGGAYELDPLLAERFCTNPAMDQWRLDEGRHPATTPGADGGRQAR